MFKLFKQREKIYLPDHSAIYTELISRPEKNVCKKIALQDNDYYHSAMPSWFVWEAPEILGTLAEMMLQYSKTAGNSLFLIDGQQKCPHVIPSIEQVTALCEVPGIVAFSPKQGDSQSLENLLQLFIRFDRTEMSKIPLHIVFHQVEMLPPIRDLEVFACSILRRNINCYFICSDRKALETKWRKEQLCMIRSTCDCELIRTFSNKTIPTVQYMTYTGDQLGADWEIAVISMQGKTAEAP